MDTTMPPAASQRIEAARSLVDHIVVCDSTRQCLVRIDALIDRPGAATLAFVNAHAFNLAWENPRFAQDLKASDLLLRDGKGMEILMTRNGRNPGANLNGTDLIPKVLERYHGRRVAILGTRNPWLERGADELRRKGSTIVLKMDGFEPFERYIEQIDRVRPDIVVLAMGMPRQERLTQHIVNAGGFQPQLIICGGAIIDFLAGRHRRAPSILRKAGLEWLFRLALEPRRLFGRYVIGNVKFLRRMGLVTKAGRKEA